jgi:Mn-dependent DtxR family transcriptional regulator
VNVDTSVLKKLWPTPSSPALKLAQISVILGVSPVEAGKKLARMEKAGLVIRSGRRMCDNQRDPVILWDTTDKGDEEIAKF